MTDPSAAPVGPSWQPDPSGRHQLRYWDGRAWTNQVASNGQQFAEYAPGDNLLPAAPPRDDDDAILRWVVPVGRSGLAIAAGYAGLFGLIIFPAPLALLLGVLALVDLRRHPTKRGRGRAIFGLIVGIIGTLILLLFMIALASE